jgi:hypothetical protein
MADREPPKTHYLKPGVLPPHTLCGHRLVRGSTPVGPYVRSRVLVIQLPRGGGSPYAAACW